MTTISVSRPLQAGQYDSIQQNIDFLLARREQLSPDELKSLQSCMRVLARGYRSNPILDELCPRVHPKQAAFLALNDREVMYGGSAGGGKSQAAIMAALQYVDVPGYSAILFRKTFTDLAGEGSLMDRAQKMLAPLAERKLCHWSASDKSFFFPTRNPDGTPGAESRVAFGYLDHSDHKFRYQGWEFQLCVAGPTLIEMADGTRKPARSLQPGDMVRTLEGPRAVLRKVGPMRRQCVTASTTTPHGTFSQIQSDNHRLLTPAGWLAFSSPSESHAAGSMTWRMGMRFREPLPALDIPATCRQRIRGSAGQLPGRHRGRETSWFSADLESDFSASGDARRAHWQLLQWSGQAVSSGPDPQSAGPILVHGSLQRAPCRGFGGCESPGFPGGCRCEPGFCDAQPLRWPGSGRSAVPSPVDAGEPCRSDRLSGGSGSAPSHSLRHPSRLVHQELTQMAGGSSAFVRPASGGTYERSVSLTHSVGRTLPECILWTPGLPALHHLSAELPHPYVPRNLQLCEPVSAHPLAMSPAGIHDVYDFTIDSASHYITEGGFVNSNCDFDELTQHPEASYRYLFSRLRRLEGSIVPIRMRSQTNPGGTHGEWVKERFIPDEYLQAEPDEQFSRIWRKTGPCVMCDGSGRFELEECTACEGSGQVSRVFVPARVEDNPSLDRQEYLASLAELPPTERAQLQHGRWDVVPDGDLFRREWFRYFSRRGDHFVLHTGPDSPDRIVPLERMAIFHTADTASKAKTHSDWTVIATWAMDTQNYDLCLLQAVRRKMMVPDLVPAVLNVYRQFDQTQFVMVEDASSGIGLIQELRTSRGKGINVKDFQPGTADKVSRATPAIIRAEAGQIYLPTNEPAWLADYINEIVAFSGDPALNDDCVDTLSMAAWWVSRLHNQKRKSTSADQPGPISRGPLGSSSPGPVGIASPSISRWG